MATPDKLDLLGTISEMTSKQITLIQAMITDLRWEHNQLQNVLEHLSPAHTIDNFRQRLDEISSRQERAIHTRLDRKDLQLANLQQSLKSLNPKAVLNRGYAIVTAVKDGNIIKNAQQVTPDEKVHIRVSQGSMEAQIMKINQENDHD
jgi:exodeoxyribonuclease VII large subunit